ncbi:MAG: cysteine desulfurase [Deltaproteobacteria bacterium]|nr:cysteine desulfurase [Deltaproteobacteria bacterium]
MAFDPGLAAVDFTILRSQAREEELHYLDNAAMALIPDCVINAMVEHDTLRRSNVKRGSHRLAEEATEAFEKARAAVADYLGVSDPDEVVFTGGATAGINILAHSLGLMFERNDEVLISQLEHHSNIIPWQVIQQRQGIKVRYLPVTPDGRINLERAEDMIKSRTRIVSVTHGSNVTGAITDARTLSGLVHDRGAFLILDGAQTAPGGPMDLPALGADFYVFSGHKVYGPTGVGILWGRKEILKNMPPALGGGEMIQDVGLEKSTFLDPPHRFEAGTPPVTQAIGLAAAVKWLAAKDVKGMRGHLRRLTLRIMEGLTQLSGGIKILGPETGMERIPLVSFCVEGLHPHDICQVMNDRHGVALRGGFHCAQPLHDFLKIDGTTRASLAIYNNDNDVDALLNGMEDCMKILG